MNVTTAAVRPEPVPSFQAPDDPGFGHSDAPPASGFPCTLDHLAEVIGSLVDALGPSTYVLYGWAYGGPIGFRLALEYPERVKGMVIQNAVCHEGGLGEPWIARRAAWADWAADEARVITAFACLGGARARLVGTSPNPDRYNPDTWAVQGCHDPSVTAAGALAKKRDVPEAGVPRFEAGHLALDEALDDIARLMRSYLAGMPAQPADQGFRQ
jgi:pimeloyl-ACP methyl ester carboxylesterase